MTVSQRAQYLCGRRVVEENWEQPGGCTIPPAAADERARTHADLQQAEYYQELLDAHRPVINDELAHHRALLAAREKAGDLSGIRLSQRIIQSMETELAAIDRLTSALSSRFPTTRIDSGLGPSK